MKIRLSENYDHDGLYHMRRNSKWVSQR